MTYKDLIKKLQTSEGEESAKLMKELGLFLKKSTPGERTTFSTECINAIPGANEKRKGSLGFLVALANVDKRLITDLLKTESPIIREQTIKGLLRQGEDYIEILEERLKEENMYRIKKWILLTLGNIGTTKVINIIKQTEVEPQLFSTKEKILSAFNKEKEIKNKISGRGGSMMVQTVSGAEESWLEAYKLTGVRFGEGILQLDGNFEFDEFANCRSIFYYGIFLGTIKDVQKVLRERFSEPEQYCIKYSNKIKGEKERLSEFQSELSKNNWEYNVQAPLTMQLLNEQEAMILVKPYIKENLEYLPASINRVVASVVNLIAENQHGKANIILDPCCGSGTLLCEASKVTNFSDAKLIGIDMDKTAIEKAKKNSKEYKVKIDYFNKKFQEVLLVKAADLVLCNPPFDIRVKGDFDHDKLIKFISKNTTKNMTAVIYTVKKYDLREACENNNLEIVKEVKLKLKKISPSVFIINKN